MPAIQLRFVRHHDLPSFLIGTFQDGFWATHVETVMPDGHYLGARFRGGVLSRPSNYDKGKIAREEFVSVNCSQLELDAYYTFLNDQLNKPYDFTAILGMVTHRDWQKPDRWFCSELEAAGFCACGKFPAHLAINFDRITPRDVRLMVSLL